MSSLLIPKSTPSGSYTDKKRDSARRSRLKRLGLTEESYADMLDAQNGLCAICGNPETKLSRYGDTVLLAVDHDHKTGKIRGLLCSRCNLVLGRLKDDVELIIGMAEYLKKHGKRDTTGKKCGNCSGFKKWCPQGDATAKACISFGRR